jgi:hypothetical protein
VCATRNLKRGQGHDEEPRTYSVNIFWETIQRRPNRFATNCKKELTLEVDAGAKAEAEANRERMQAAANFMVGTIVDS